MGWSKQLKLVVSFSVALMFLPVNSGIASANDKSLIPMGHSIGIKMDLSGVFLTNDVLLGKDEWLKAGDLIGQVDGAIISNVENFEDALTRVGNKEDISVLLTRNGETLTVRSDNEAMKRLLPFLKDSTEGTGTLTYVDPEKKTYGALGHQIIDSSFKSPPSFKEGTIHLSEIEQIRKSSPGNPGYKISTIVKDEETLGTIRKNGVYGIFGSWNNSYKEVLSEPLQIMHQGDVKVGKAEIFTTVKGTEVESFSIEITNVEQDQFHFKLTDSKLLETTGGILQGMSGSPVIQDGKFAGAVTHMFIDEPEKGAALFLETMRKGEN
ncbi:SpoIVB peptidase S55 domain-containing protein [Sporosarcina ureilytica]|uniref:SpoIVB peptidase S55 domain-containing protein n=1 Tax=Sporosarcina ureilytica TaxID=298596 RepID=UPI0009E359B3|nr:SpoIVB peptidase S55 domain-containing protein [Sporosarcina ureilytica]